MFAVRRVVGRSMYPTLKPGRIVVFRRTWRISAGDIVLAHDGSREVVKRVHAIQNDKVDLRGDNTSESHNIVVNLGSLQYKKTLL